MKIIGYILAFSVIVNLLDRFVRAYETKVKAGIEVDKKAMETMSLNLTELLEFPNEQPGLS